MYGSARSVAERLADRLRGRVDEFLIIAELVRSEMLKLARGEATVVQAWNTVEVQVYVARSDGRILLTGLSTPTPEESVDAILGLLEKAEPSPMYAPLPSASGESYQLVDAAIARHLEGEERLDLAHDLEAETLGDLAGMVLLGHEERVLVNSHGDTLRGEKTLFTGYVRAFHGDHSGQWSWASTRYDSARQARRAISHARELAEECAGLPREKPEPGEYRILLGPMVAGSLVDSLIEMANAGSVILGSSFLRPESVGERLFSDALTIFDAPRLADLPGYTLFDDEGVATRDKAVIRGGVLETLLHNTKTARLLGAETTGNAGILMPRPMNIVVEPGDIGSSELLDALGTGIYATNNWYTRFQNYAEGTFSTVTRDAAFLVRGGKPRACLSRFRITGRLGDLFKSVEGLGREQWDLRWWEIPVPTRTPHILLSRAGVTSV